MIMCYSCATMKYILFSLAFGTLFVAIRGNPQYFLSDEFIESINKKNTTWKAGKNLKSLPLLQQLREPIPKTENVHDLPIKIYSVNLAEIPESFDAREAWPECASVIGDIQDEGGCSSGWAVAAASVITDRICIYSKGEVNITISAEDLNDCCTDCNYGCTGGIALEAWYYWSSKGIVTGGKYGTNNGCRTYSFPPCDHHNTTNGSLKPCSFEVYTGDCVSVCDDGSPLIYEDDLQTGAPYQIRPIEAEIQTEIMMNGPVESYMDLYQDFYAYKSGVYQRVTGNYVNGQGVKIIGWGVEDGTPYWLAVNSWNEFWGENGLFKILRGSDECAIEDQVFGGLPKLQ